MRTGTIVDATIIDAPSSTKNKDGKRDPEMHQTKKGNEWYFGMKGHIGVDSQSKMIHSVAATAANVHDSQLLGDLLHGDETRVWGDSAYTGQGEVIRKVAPNAKDFTNKKASRNRRIGRINAIPRVSRALGLRASESNLTSCRRELGDSSRNPHDDALENRADRREMPLSAGDRPSASPPLP